MTIIKALKPTVIIKTLERMFPDPVPPLHFRNNYELLVAVILSAQATDISVNKATPDLFRKAPDWDGLRALGQDGIRKIIAKIGLANSKSKHLYESAGIVLNRFGGKIPDNFTDLISLPGVGEKTAQVFMIHGLKIPAFPVDTHILRISGRWGISRAKTAPKTSLILKRLFPQKLWEKLHLQMIFFGRQICRAGRPKCVECPLADICPKIGVKNV